MANKKKAPNKGTIKIKFNKFLKKKLSNILHFIGFEPISKSLENYYSISN